MKQTSSASLLRERKDGSEARVGSVELFFDLVFVFAVTQLSHFLLHQLTPLGAVQTCLLLMAGLVGVDSTRAGSRTGSIPTRRKCA